MKKIRQALDFNFGVSVPFDIGLLEFFNTNFIVKFPWFFKKTKFIYQVNFKKNTKKFNIEYGIQVLLFVEDRKLSCI